MKKLMPLAFTMLILVGCTISFQNIATHGTATDLVDENQTPTNTATTSLEVPLK